VRNNRYGAHRCTDFGAICIIPNAGLLLFVLIVASGDADAVTKKERQNQNSNRGGRCGGAGFSEGGFDRSDLSNWETKTLNYFQVENGIINGPKVGREENVNTAREIKIK
jgi:hypothetical protein